MNFKEAFKHLQNGKAIIIEGGKEERCYPVFCGHYFLIKDGNKIIDSNGLDVTFNMLQTSLHDDLEWGIYEPTKEDLLHELIELKSSYHPIMSGQLNKHNLLSPKEHILLRQQREMQDGSARLK
jgi:hypothetical protein